MKFDPSKGHSANYVADHIARIESQHAGNQNLILDSMWRIASHCDLFARQELEEQLTAKQITTVEGFINDFKANHHRLVQQYRKARA